jgi:hypothetical protein
MNLDSIFTTDGYELPAEPGTVASSPFPIARRNAPRRTSGGELPAVPYAGINGLYQ